MWQKRLEKVSRLDSLPEGHTWENPSVLFCSEAGGQDTRAWKMDELGVNGWSLTIRFRLFSSSWTAAVVQDHMTQSEGSNT